MAGKTCEFSFLQGKISGNSFFRQMEKRQLDEYSCLEFLNGTCTTDCNLRYISNIYCHPFEVFAHGSLSSTCQCSGIDLAFLPFLWQQTQTTIYFLALFVLYKRRQQEWRRLSAI
jgi:hypothetical protein